MKTFVLLMASTTMTLILFGQPTAAQVAVPVGGEFQVNTYTTGPQDNPAVDLDIAGNFVVVWRSAGSSGAGTSEYSIQGRLYASDGSPVGPDGQINTYTTSNQVSPVVGIDSDGDFVVVWRSDGSGGTDDSGTSIQGQSFSISLFVDGFESGNTSHWSSSSP